VTFWSGFRENLRETCRNFAGKRRTRADFPTLCEEAWRGSPAEEA
jgi:hypothetical protein